MRRLYERSNLVRFFLSLLRDTLRPRQAQPEARRTEGTGKLQTARTVSVIMIFLNGGRFLEEAMRSVLDQTHTLWEILLVDDGSTDGSTEIARHFAAKDPDRIYYLEHPGHVNRGMSASRNLAIRHARGDYLAFLDADDIWLPEKLERQVAVLEQYPEAAMTYGPLHFWYGWTGDLADAQRDFIQPIGTEHDVLIPPPRMLLRQIEKRDGLPAPCSVLVRRKIAEEVGGFEDTFRDMYEDEVFFSKIALRAPVFVTSRLFERYRQHPDSFSARAAESGEYSFDPAVANPSRGRFLRWLDAYIAETGLDDGTLGRALQIELEPYRAKSRSGDIPAAPHRSAYYGSGFDVNL